MQSELVSLLLLIAIDFVEFFHIHFDDLFDWPAFEELLNVATIGLLHPCLVNDNVLDAHLVHAFLSTDLLRRRLPALLITTACLFNVCCSCAVDFHDIGDAADCRVISCQLSLCGLDRGQGRLLTGDLGHRSELVRLNRRL